MSFEFPQPTVLPKDDTILVLAEHYAGGMSGDGTAYDIWLAGAFFECTLTKDGSTTRRERIDIRPMLNAWVTDLLNRKD